jgi:predicted ATPase
MGKKNYISRLTIKGFKSIRMLDQFDFAPLNLLIGANGAGKSNLVSYFKMLGELVECRLQKWTSSQGSADRIVSFGVRETKKIESFVEFGNNGYKFELEPTVEGGFFFADENLFFHGPYYGKSWYNLGSGHKESNLKERFEADASGSVADYCYTSISNWKVFHFHDTSDTAGVKRLVSLQDNEYLRSDASNLAAFLYKLKNTNKETYEKIRKVVQLAIPFFDDFVLKPHILPTEEEQIRLLWRQRDSDYPFWPSQLSDGSIRFICLATALLQPHPSTTIVIDEPELGLHPYAITLLGSLLKSASKRMQVIVSTQSVALVNEFSVGDLVIVERENDETVFKRYEEDEFKAWLEDYSVGELWEKNILGGRPRK